MDGSWYPTFTMDNRQVRVSLLATSQQAGVPVPLSCFMGCGMTGQQETKQIK